MPPKRKTKGRKRRTIRKRLSSAARGAKRRVSAAARYARRNPGRTAGGLAGAGALGLAGYEGYLAAKRGMDVMNSRMIDLPEGAEDPYGSPTAAAFRRGRRGVTAAREYFNDPNRDMRGDISKRARAAYESARGVPGRVGRAGSGFLDRLFPGRVTRRKQKKVDAQRRAFNAADGTLPGDNIGSPYGYGYGKRRRRRRKSRCGSYGKKASKKPSAATRRMCKKLKVRLTTKRGGKRVYKSEAMLKKQCKKAMKRKSKK